MVPTTHLSHIIVNGDIKQVKNYLTQEKNVDINEDCGIALREAIRIGKLDIIKLLVDRRADIHVIEDCAIRIAAEYGHTEIFKYFLSFGLMPDKFCLTVATKNGFIDIVKIIMEQGMSPTQDMINMAKNNGHNNIVKMFSQ